MSSGGEAVSEVLNKINPKWVALIAGLTVLFLIIRALLAPSLAVETGMAAPDFTLEGTDGKTYTINKFRDVPVVLSFWAPDCEECVAELSAKSAFARSHPEVQVLAVSIGDFTLEQLADAEYEHDIRFPVLETSAQVQQRYGIHNLPVTMLVDDQGVIRQIQEGEIGKPRLNVWIR